MLYALCFMYSTVLTYVLAPSALCTTQSCLPAVHYCTHIFTPLALLPSLPAVHHCTHICACALTL
jgi:hypothetical protein